MIFGKTKMELKVGVFVFFGLCILITFILSIGGFKTWTSGYNVSFAFDFVNGIKAGAPVRVAGVDVGQVKNIVLFYDPDLSIDRVRVECWVKKEVNIPRDSAVTVNSLGMLGERYVEVMPGKDFSDLLMPGQELNGIAPVSMQDLTVLAKNIGTKIDTAITRINDKQGTVGKLLFDDKLYNELDAFASDIRQHPWKLMWKE